jgi:hypothetical protein
MQDGDDAWAEFDEEDADACSDMEDDSFEGPWQPRRFPWPHPLDVEE